MNALVSRWLRQQGTQCLGDCPDAAYFGPNILEHSDVIDMLNMSGDAALPANYISFCQCAVVGGFAFLAFLVYVLNSDGVSFY